MNWHFYYKIVLLQERVADICIQNLKTVGLQHYSHECVTDVRHNSL